MKVGSQMLARTIRTTPSLTHFFYLDVAKNGRDRADVALHHTRTLVEEERRNLREASFPVWYVEGEIAYRRQKKLSLVGVDTTGLGGEAAQARSEPHLSIMVDIITSVLVSAAFRKQRVHGVGLDMYLHREPLLHLPTASLKLQVLFAHPSSLYPTNF